MHILILSTFSCICRFVSGDLLSFLGGGKYSYWQFSMEHQTNIKLLRDSQTWCWDEQQNEGGETWYTRQEKWKPESWVQIPEEFQNWILCQMQTHWYTENPCSVAAWFWGQPVCVMLLFMYLLIFTLYHFSVCLYFCFWEQAEMH